MVYIVMWYSNEIYNNLNNVNGISQWYIEITYKMNITMIYANDVSEWYKL